MQKKLLTVAVSAALALPVVAHAEATWYGSIRNSLSYLDDGTNDDFDVDDHSSRIGVKGSNDLGNGLSVPYRFELQLSSEDSSGVKSGRLGRVGLAGGFGAVHIGQLWGPYYNHLSWTDQFNSVGFVHYKGNFRISNALRYDLPGVSGISLQAALQTEDDNNDENVDAINLGASWSNDMFAIGVGYIGDEEADTDLFGIGANASFGGFGIGFLYEDADDENTVDENGVRNGNGGGALQVVANYSDGPNIYRIGFSTEDDSEDGFEDDAFQIGWQHNLGNSSRVAVEYQHIDKDNSAEEDSDNIRFFIRTDF